MYIEPFYYLGNLLGGYFHQDAHISGDTDEDIMRQFRDTSWEYQRLGVRADIDRFLHQNADHLLEAINQAFSLDIIVGKTDAEVGAWLLKIKVLLENPQSDVPPRTGSRY
jgi:hypothetical protein